MKLQPDDGARRPNLHLLLRLILIPSLRDDGNCPANDRRVLTIFAVTDMMRILVVEDEPDLLNSLARALREEGYAVDTAAEGEDGLFKAESADYDAVVLDVMLPRLD